MTLFDCPCSQRKDRSGYHRHRGEPLCSDAVEYERAKGRRKYAAAQARKGITVTPIKRAGDWVAGSPILVLEVDPL